jgi:hypothetical protein
MVFMTFSRPRRVEHGGGLVQHEAVRVHGHDARDGHALLLPAGQLVRRAVAVFVDAGHLHRGVDPGADLGRGHAQIFEGERHVLLDDGGDDLVVRVLEHHAHLLADVVEMRSRRSCPMPSDESPCRFRAAGSR